MCRVTCVTATLAAASRQEGRLLHYALHRAIALRTQTCFKEGAGAATGAATALVRLLDQRFAEGHQLPCSAAARALATCAARPRPPSAAAASRARQRPDLLSRRRPRGRRGAVCHVRGGERPGGRGRRRPGRRERREQRR